MNYIKELSKLYIELNTNPDKGLDTKQVEAAREKYGENKFKEKKPVSFIERLVNQLKDFMIIILIIASLLSFF